jgi:streptomycin 6-kinase
LPPRLIQHVEQGFGETGTAWLDGLPGLLQQVSERWSLTLEPHFPEVSFSYVAPATRADGSGCVLKVAVSNDELRSEIDALREWNGAGSVRLLDVDSDAGALLLERILPGTSLADSGLSEDQATRAAAAVMGSLWRAAPSGENFSELNHWFRSLFEYREQQGSTSRFSSGLLERAQVLTRELIATTDRPVLLHGDLHHFNILRSGRAGWLAIDPKGLIGDAGFEVAAFLRNPAPRPRAMLARRLDIFAAELGLDRSRLRDWCFDEAMLNACWSLEDNDGQFERKLAWAELMLDL